VFHHVADFLWVVHWNFLAADLIVEAELRDFYCSFLGLVLELDYLDGAFAGLIYGYLPITVNFNIRHLSPLICRKKNMSRLLPTLRPCPRPLFRKETTFFLVLKKGWNQVFLVLFDDVVPQVVFGKPVLTGRIRAPHRLLHTPRIMRRQIRHRHLRPTILTRTRRLPHNLLDKHRRGLHFEPLPAPRALRIPSIHGVSGAIAAEQRIAALREPGVDGDLLADLAVEMRRLRVLGEEGQAVLVLARFGGGLGLEGGQEGLVVAGVDRGD
jgi:hypothetical protein